MSRKVWLLALAVGIMGTAWAGAQPYKALIVTGQNAHDWKATTPVLKKILEDTGLFTVDVAVSPPKIAVAKGEKAKPADMSGFHPEFAKYSVVVSNYQGDPWSEPTKQALVDYVKNGGGLVIYHFALAAFPDWKEYNDMIGLGGWGGRTEKNGAYLRWREGKIVRDALPGKSGSHGPAHAFQIVVREPNHPVTQGLPPAFMHVKDELYGWLRGPGENLTVLATAFASKEHGGSGEHEPVLFTIQYGKGRVIQNCLGHSVEQLSSVSFIVTFQRCVEWAATGKVTQKVPADFPTAEKASVRP
jgi:type 1 glutamine amidotransferase